MIKDNGFENTSGNGELEDELLEALNKKGLLPTDEEAAAAIPISPPGTDRIRPSGSPVSPITGSATPGSPACRWWIKRISKRWFCAPTRRPPAFSPAAAAW